MPKIVKNHFEELARQKCQDDNIRFSLSNIAKLTGVHRNTLTSYVKNKVQQPDWDTVYKLCKWLNCEIDDFFDDTFSEFKGNQRKDSQESDESPEGCTLLPA